MIFRKGRELPAEVDLFRHSRSQFTESRDILHRDPLYPEFHRLYLAEYSNQSPSTRLEYLARILRIDHPRAFQDPFPPLASLSDPQELGASLRQEVASGRLKKPDVIVVAPLMRTWLTFQGIQAEFPELTDMIAKQQVIVDLGGLNNRRLKRIVKTDGLMSEDWRVAGKDYGDISNYPEEDIYFALNWDQQRRRASLGDKAEFSYKPPHGENIQDVMNRMKKWEEYIAKKYPGKVVWVFGQLDTILAFTVLAQGFTGDAAAEEFLRLRRDNKPAHGRLTQFVSQKDTQGTERYVLTDYNRPLSSRVSPQ